MKQLYTKMTVQCEQFALNEAICAGCTFVSDGITYACDNCYPVGRHTWTVFYNSDAQFGIGISGQTCWENDYSGNKPAGVIEVTGECGKYPIQAGHAFRASDPGRYQNGVYLWDGNGDGSHSSFPYGYTEVPLSEIGSSNGSLIYNQTS